MAEPEELIIEGAHVATRIAREAWRRYGPERPSRGLPLTTVRTRLELFATALVGAPIAIAPIPPPAPVTWLARLAHGRSFDSQLAGLRSGTDGRRVYLPEHVEPTSVHADLLQIYRLLAVEQAVRLVRRAAAHVALERADLREWFLLAEGISIDRWIASEVPGLAGVLASARADALASRLRTSRGPLRQPLEEAVRSALASDPRMDVLGLGGATPQHSIEWARAAARRHRGTRPPAVPPVWCWGIPLHPSTMTSAPLLQVEAFRDDPARSPRVAEMPRSPRVRESADDEDDRRTGTWVIRADEPQESVEDPFGLQRPADHDEDADPEGLGDSLSELPEARAVRTPGRPREVLRSGDELERSADYAGIAPAGSGISYPEWDWRARCYREPGAIVRERSAAQGDVAWVSSARARHARLVRRVRARFERLRPRPVRLDRQPDGSDLDLAACVTAAADARAGTAVDGRLYMDRRPARRELAVALLVDTSASTDAWVSADRRIVDVEKEALLVVCEALDALGDRYAIFAFSGEGPEDVSVLPVKGFGERTSLAVHRRIAALDSDRYTRLGAPIRHVTAGLANERASRRLLLVLSDGKPNDVDLYEGRYGVEDARQAVREAHAQGISVFCLTVDREAPRYAGRVFGPARFAVLNRAEQLPVVLIDVLRQLVRG
jgi:nitric oxide reductase NorD protein